MSILKGKKIMGVLVVGLAFFLSSAAFSAESIKIGAMFISSGKMGGYGKHARQAIQLALDEINAEGGILNRTVEAIVEDTELKKDVAMDLARRFVEQDKVDFLMGPT